jgi:ATP-dependent exoDNAse (exonuclease V) alpha subunit
MHDHHIAVTAAEDPTKEVRVERIQRSIAYTSYQRTLFPLTLAWAFTIHKVQSLTLSNFNFLKFL